MPLRRRPLAFVAFALVLVPLLAACTSTVSLQPAPKANTVGCANVIVHLPDSLESLKKRDTSAQGTSAWGTPAAIVLTCGITTPTVSGQACFSPGGVDWLISSRGPGNKTSVYTTYGRVPGVQVVVDTTAVPTATNVLFDLASSIKTLKQTHRCESVSEVTPSPTATPAP